jgi:hypothetical protein
MAWVPLLARPAVRRRFMVLIAGQASSDTLQFTIDDPLEDVSSA